MPARSKAQQKAAGAALSARRGEIGKSQLKRVSRSMYESMTESQLEEFAETRRKGLPNRKGSPRTRSKSRSSSSRSKTKLRTRSRGLSRSR